MKQTLTNGAPASVLVCVCACMYDRETREAFAAKSREVFISNMRKADVPTTKTEPLV